MARILGTFCICAACLVGCDYSTSRKVEPVAPAPNGHKGNVKIDVPGVKVDVETQNDDRGNKGVKVDVHPKKD